MIMTTNRKSSWLQRFEGIEVYDPHKNNGLYVFINAQTNDKVGGEYKRLTICPFYRDDEGKRIWKYRGTQMGKQKSYEPDGV